MKRLFFPFTLFILAFLSGCYGLAESLSLKICGQYAVPGMLHFDLKGTETICSVIEEDSEGRILFEFSGNNMISGEDTSYLVICQAVEREFVYFYEDVCYIKKTETQEIISSFKSANDWGKPLNKERTTFRPNKASLDLFIVLDTDLSVLDVKKAVFAETGIASNDADTFFLIDISPSGQALYCVKTEEYIIFAVVSQDMKCTFLKIPSSKMDLQIITEIKKQANWQFGSQEAGD